MKKIFLTLGIILFVFIAKSQSLVDTNMIWSEIEEYYDNNATLIQETKYIKFTGDTTINAYHYKKVMRSDDEFMTIWYHYNDYYIREDTSKKVFLYTSGADRLIYNFGVNAGDTVSLFNQFDTNYTVYIDTVYMENVLGFDRKKIVLSDSLGCYGIWYENIGNYDGMFLPQWGLCGITGPSYAILCVKENGNLIYQNPNYSECFYITGINDNILNNSINIYPNPAKNNLYIRVNNNDLNLNVELYNSLGAVIYNDNFTGDLIINTSSFSSGIYFLKLTNTKTNIVKKIIIQ